MKPDANILTGMWRSFSWTLTGVLTVLRGPVAFTRLLIAVLGRILKYSLLGIIW
jgi:hypothetical protein